MKLIFDDEVRSKIEYFFEKNKTYVHLGNIGERIDIKQLDDIGKLIQERSSDSRKSAIKYLSKELSLAYLGAKALGILCLSFDHGRSNKPICRGEKENINPNFIIEKLLVQLTNYTLSTIYLIESGMTSSSKIIMRSIYELSSLIIVLIMEKDKMMLYAQDIDRKEEKKLWREEFQNLHLNNLLTKFEKEIGFPDDIVDVMISSRTKIYADYSQSLHNSYASSMLNAFSVSPEDEDMLEFGLFGKFSKSAEKILGDLNFLLFYFISAIQPVLEKYHGFTIPRDEHLWDLFYNLRICYTNIYYFIVNNE